MKEKKKKLQLTQTHDLAGVFFFFFLPLFPEELVHLITCRKLTSKQFESIPLGSRQEEWAGPAILKAKKKSLWHGSDCISPKTPHHSPLPPHHSPLPPPTSRYSSTSERLCTLQLPSSFHSIFFFASVDKFKYYATGQ